MIETSCLIDFTIYYHDEIKKKGSTWEGSHLSNTEKFRNGFRMLSKIPKDRVDDVSVEDSMILKSILGMYIVKLRIEFSGLK
jgi:hypothetical protein